LKENKSLTDFAKPTFYYIGGSGGIRTHTNSSPKVMPARREVFEKQTKLF
jgi:hypothetical protein